MKKTVNIIWFKRDLRVHDHRPLSEAAKAGFALPLYIIEPSLWQLPDSSRRHWHFIYDSLVDLKRELNQLGNDLIIRIGEAIPVFEQLYRELGKFSLFSHEETGNGWTYARDIQVAAWCQSHQIRWHESPTNGVIRRLKTRDGWSLLRQERMQAEIILPPQQLIIDRHINSDALPGKNHPLFGSQEIGSVQTGGRQSGLGVLKSFLANRSKHYMQTISKPGVSARHCSRLSAHITYGNLSIAEITEATRTKMADLAESPDTQAPYFRRNLSAFLSRLVWHCHFIQKLEQQPDIEFKCMHPAFEGMREPYFKEDFFYAWQKGLTGYPLIDACMRSLHQNGWLTFRMRAMLVSFASYHLWLDWRKTAPFLAQLFTDYEPGIHYAQFQMQSGVTGINAIRMYNPIKQSYDHDPQGKFIRRYLPELHSVPDEFIHEPWLWQNSALKYPLPIVDHAIAVTFARAEIAKRSQGESYKAASKGVKEKLASRRGSSKRKKSQKEPNNQLSFDL